MQNLLKAIKVNLAVYSDITDPEYSLNYKHVWE